MSDGDRAAKAGDDRAAKAGDDRAAKAGDDRAAKAGDDRAAKAGDDRAAKAGAGSASVAGEASTLDPSEIDVDALTGPERSLEPRIRLVWLLRSALAAVVLGAVAGALAVAFSAPVWVAPAVFTVLFVLGIARAHLRYEAWSYRVRRDSLFLDRGVLTRVKTVVPYVRIQHVDASRGPVERALGLATVVVYTAGSRGADVSIPGLTPEDADDLQERLKRLAIAAEGEDAV